jgi:hypothetical protein
VCILRTSEHLAESAVVVRIAYGDEVSSGKTSRIGILDQVLKDVRRLVQHQRLITVALINCAQCLITLPSKPRALFGAGSRTTINTPSVAGLDMRRAIAGAFEHLTIAGLKLIKDRPVAGKFLSVIPPSAGYIGWPLGARRVVKLSRLLNLPLPQLGYAPLAVDSEHL